MVEVYTTNIQHQETADFILRQLQKEFPAYSINFDLEDCDNILRVACDQKSINVEGIISYIKNQGYTIEVLAGEMVFDG